MVGLLLAGCGGDDGGEDTDGATSAASSDTTAGPTTDDPPPDSTGPEPGTSSSGEGSTGDSGTTSVDPDDSSGSSSSDTGPMGATASAMIMGLGDNDALGTATFTQAGDEVTLVIELQDVLPQGPHGIHIHEVGDCSSPDGTSTGGHWNPYGAMHGMLGMGESHLGDLGNVQVERTGEGTLMITTDAWTIGTGDDTDVVGRGIILHEGEDNLMPDANPGPRIACGVIELDGG